MKLDGAAAAAHGLQLGRLGRVIEARIDAQRREVEAARHAHQERERELAAQQALLDAAQARADACRRQIAALRQGRFSPFDAPGHNAAQARLAKAQRQQAEATRSAEERVQIAWIALAEARTTLRRLQTRADAIAQLGQRSRRAAALHRETLQEVGQDDDFAARYR